MKKHNYLFILLAFLLMTCSDNGDDINNTAPGIFSANTIETRFDGATIEWTESLDPDGDDVTYAIILEGQEIASGGTTLSYSFSGLEPETLYEGYVEARDGNGGTSQASYFFTTEPEVIIYEVDIECRWWEGAGGYGIVNYFEINAVEDAISYHVEILDYAPDPIPSNVGRTYSWTPESNLPTGNNVGSGSSHLTEYSPGVYHANTSTGSGSLIYLDDAIANCEAVVATARVTIIVGE
ncbi:fibronectin type III domain-containing protein [Winogradskyella algicola]|uniref:fibronectin type III domain-containing protein n=1 Tax=Winogradskyella algicola TaxID=2575815 RepID=UPI001107CFF7|nr:fibronectin type III domain-containing protein [Winogradskyella algicola]